MKAEAEKTRELLGQNPHINHETSQVTTPVKEAQQAQIRHIPDTIWSKLDLASGCLSRDLGVKTMSWKVKTQLQ